MSSIVQQATDIDTARGESRASATYSDGINICLTIELLRRTACPSDGTYKIISFIFATPIYELIYIIIAHRDEHRSIYAWPLLTTICIVEIAAYYVATRGSRPLKGRHRHQRISRFGLSRAYALFDFLLPYTSRKYRRHLVLPRRAPTGLCRW